MLIDSKEDVIRNNLSVLVGMPFKSIGRVGDLVWLGFGEYVSHTNLKGNTVTTSKYAIHIQCAFRIINPTQIILSNLDIYTENSKTAWSEDFNWDVSGANLFDERAKELMEIISEDNICVVAVMANECGDLQIILSNKCIIEVFVNLSSNDECWRFFETGTEKEHFVVTGQGI